ncbi:class I SAM-dependent methyltransferase [Leucobacter denitrificans]|uniref:Methyltransferase domain-containing protein n=1 Tax=Leucobacter denitrificans TaxID=683042 RepID=A0A7G9S3F5_9MICO|nr:class I SAM-dependent methyltransferase [Leucobacter denitrificans]QNN62380.1 methyltransferase domain-containing protein [Leucobacter denitrificans]
MSEQSHEHADHSRTDLQTEELHPEEYWERRYASAGAVWSGEVNASLSKLVRDLTPGTALDLGCGEGGDVLWLAEQGWEVAGIDLSPTAIERATRAAVERGFTHARFYAADLGRWADQPASVGGPIGPFDLVTASFFQSPVELQREHILRAASSRVAVGGHLVLVSHASGRPGHTDPPEDQPDHFVSPEDELTALALDASQWRVLVAERRRRSDAADHHPDDTVVVAQRIA